MKLTQIGPNETEVEFNNGVVVLFSYAGPVAAFKPGIGYLKTDAFFSKTSLRHVDNWLRRRDCADAVEVPHAVIDNIVGSV